MRGLRDIYVEHNRSNKRTIHSLVKRFEENFSVVDVENQLKKEMQRVKKIFLL